MSSLNIRTWDSCRKGEGLVDEHPSTYHHRGDKGKGEKGGVSLPS
jgi:hypothetical protein